jgi:hypothetical protein
VSNNANVLDKTNIKSRKLQQLLQNYLNFNILALLQAIRLLMPPPNAKPKKPFGFHSKKSGKKR